jgi:hypothetical protein
VFLPSSRSHRTRDAGQPPPPAGADLAQWILRSATVAAFLLTGSAVSATTRAEETSCDFTAKMSPAPRWAGAGAGPGKPGGGSDGRAVLSGSSSCLNHQQLSGADLALPLDPVEFLNGRGGGASVGEGRAGSGRGRWGQSGDRPAAFADDTESPLRARGWKADPDFPGVAHEPAGTLPSTLDFGGAYLDVTPAMDGVRFRQPKTREATSNPESVPELDPASGAGAIVFARRWRSVPVA